MSISINPENCEYIAEGNAGIVIRFIKEGTVLRLKKHDNSSTAPSIRNDLKELENEIKILNNVLKQILGEFLANNPHIIFLKKEEIKILNEAISRLRPAHRIHKNIKEEDTHVHMFPDYCTLNQKLKVLPTYGPVLCIEIKPKQGFTKYEYLPFNSFAQCPSMCRFCMKQKYKLKKGSISSKSGYCPIDLYSGCYKRMLHALKMLLKSPQNNLRIFKDRKLIYSEEKKENLNEILSDFVSPKITSLEDLLCDLIIQALVKPFPSENASSFTTQKKFLQNCVNVHTVCSDIELQHELPLYCVLERILSGQLLDDLPIADLYQLYLQVKKSLDEMLFKI